MFKLKVSGILFEIRTLLKILSINDYCNYKPLCRLFCGSTGTYNDKVRTTICMHTQRYIRLFTFDSSRRACKPWIDTVTDVRTVCVRPPAVRYVQSQTASEVQPPTAYGTRTTTGTKNNRQSFCKSVAINFSSFWATLLAWNTENTSRTVEKVVRGFGESFGSNELLITVFRGKIYFLHIER